MSSPFNNAASWYAQTIEFLRSDRGPLGSGKGYSVWEFTLLRQNSTFVAEAATSAEQVAPSFRTGMISLRQRLLRTPSAIAYGVGRGRATEDGKEG